MKGLKTGGGPRKAKYDIAPQIRAAFLAAVEELERRSGKTYAQMMAEWMQKDPIAVLNMVSRFNVRESEINQATDQPWQRMQVTFLDLQSHMPTRAAFLPFSQLCVVSCLHLFLHLSTSSGSGILNTALAATSACISPSAIVTRRSSHR